MPSRGAERIVDDISPESVGTASRDVGRRPSQTDVCTVRAHSVNRPVTHQERDLSGDVHMSYDNRNRHPDPLEFGVRAFPGRAGFNRSRRRNEHPGRLVNQFQQLGRTGIERGLEHQWMLVRLGRQRQTGVMGSQLDVIHGHSEAAADVGHQTETDQPGRRRYDGDPRGELVPDERGRTDRPDPNCPVEVALAAISGRWMTLVLRELTAAGEHGLSFAELRAALPALSQKVLTERLRTLTGRGLVRRTETAGFPVRTRYHLTPAGQLLRPLLVRLYATGSQLLDKRQQSSPAAALMRR